MDEVIELLSGLEGEGRCNDEAFRQHDDSCDPALSDSWRNSFTTVRVHAVYQAPNRPLRPFAVRTKSCSVFGFCVVQ